MIIFKISSFKRRKRKTFFPND